MVNGNLAEIFGQPDDYFRLFDVSHRRITNASGGNEVFVDINAGRLFLGVYITNPLVAPVFSLTSNPASGPQFPIGGAGFKEMSALTHPGFVQSRIFWSANAGDFVDVIEVTDRSTERQISMQGVNARIGLQDALRRVKACISRTISR